MTASARLLRLTLNEGWFVFESVASLPRQSGGTFSHSYLAKKGKRIGFVKALDFSSAFKPGANTLNMLRFLTTSYEHERDVLDLCRKKKLSHVVVAISAGQVTVPDMGDVEGRVYYLIFEKAEGDIRRQMDETAASDVVWCMSALRCVCLGLWQIHRQFIAHQDLKPSNILCYDETLFKVSDFGRSSRRGHPISHDDESFPGDMTYAPPEALYGYMHPDFVVRRVGSDIYMLGNIAAFLFTGVNVSASLLSQLDPQFHWSSWNGGYTDVLPYLEVAFSRVLEEIEARLPEVVRAEVSPIIRELCTPDLKTRGYPKRIGMFDQYSLERYVTKLTNSAWRVGVNIRAGRRVI